MKHKTNIISSSKSTEGSRRMCFIFTSRAQFFIRGAFSDPVRVKVEGFVGDSAILSCSIPENEIQDKIEKLHVIWRDDKGKKVCDIIGGSIAEDQEPEYKVRVETFPEEYKKGNFSIKLSSLQKNDARKFHCYITRDTFQKEVITELHVRDKPEGRGNHGALSLIVLLISFLFTHILPFI
ncbi:ICOS ligand-like [Carassius auratus]|uniref:ICOS ligand-like n=1 Tax=Carassius auratus TaxID=7957 RepID=A0A6P6J3M9_CARAU|nr:ICOS ligand-like [Carassius auratus]